METVYTRRRQETDTDSMENYKTFSLIVVALILQGTARTESGRIVRRSDSTPFGVQLLEQPCPESLPVRAERPYVSPFILDQLRTLLRKVEDIVGGFSNRLGSPQAVLTILKNYPRASLGLITRPMGTRDLERALDSSMGHEELLEVKYWLLVYTVYSDYVSQQEQRLVDDLFLTQSDSFVQGLGTIIQSAATLICEVHLTIAANSVPENLAMFQSVRSISRSSLSQPAELYAKNYVLFYDFKTFISYAITFFSDWVSDIER